MSGAAKSNFTLHCAVIHVVPAMPKRRPRGAWPKKQRVGKTTTQHCVDGGGSNFNGLFILKLIFGSILIQIVKQCIVSEMLATRQRNIA